jgi:hypothetical protein
MTSRRDRKKGRIGTGRRDWLWFVAILSVGGAAVFLLVVALSGGSDPDEPTIRGIECEAGEQLEYHVHPELLIFIDGQPVQVPPKLGIVSGECFYWLHTHGDQPLIHVEAPADMGFTLGQFFAIWGQPLSATQLLDRTADAEHQIRATVNGEVWPDDPATIPLDDGLKIQIEYGPPFQE